jgi:Ca2+-transporting ATPase
MFVDQFKDFLVILLLVAAAVSGVVGDLKDAVAIVAILLLNAVIGYVQESRAEKAMQALKELATPSALVRRGGEETVVPATHIVPGDIVLLSAGDKVPADLRLLESFGLQIDESTLTGESVPVEKTTEAIERDGLVVADQRNMAFMGTSVTHGRGTGIVVATGPETQLGRISLLIRDTDDVKTPLQRRLAEFGRHISLVALAIIAIIFVAGLIRGEGPLLLFLTAVSLAVAAVPEALPAVVTISLALGAARMVRRAVLIRKLPAVETLGSVTYVCTDKTGTLTLNRLRVEEIWEPQAVPVPSDQPPRSAQLEILRLGALCNDARQKATNGSITWTGDPLDVALAEAAGTQGIDKALLDRQYPRIGELPFDSVRKRMTTLHRFDDGFLIVTKGALEHVLDICSHVSAGQNIAPLGPDERATIEQASEAMAARGLRFIGIASRYVAEPPQSSEWEGQLVFRGIVGMIDPPRPEARESVALARKAGIRPVMITGDHPLTARVIAEQLGILRPGDLELTGSELATLSMQEFEEKVHRISVYARVEPEHKLKIVRALQGRGQIVAMTGDGVNDAPALRAADIGVAMGTGTEVAKEASDMVLLDNNFSTVLAAVEEGRRIYDNIRKFIKYTMTSNSGELWVIFLAPFLGLPIPLLPIHILWINLATDGLPGLALAFEPAERGIMSRPPRHPKESVLAGGVWQHMLWVGLLMAGVPLLVQEAVLREGDPAWQTMVFSILCLSQLGHAMAIRSDTESLFTMGLWSNVRMWGAVILTLAAQLAIIYVPLLNEIFHTVPLSPRDLIIVLAASPVVFVAVEIEKAIKRFKASGVS